MCVCVCVCVCVCICCRCCFLLLLLFSGGGGDSSSFSSSFLTTVFSLHDVPVIVSEEGNGRRSQFDRSVLTFLAGRKR